MTKVKLSGVAANAALIVMLEVAPWHVKGKLQEEIDKLTPLGITITVKRNKPKHTDAQSGYYWMCLNLFAKHYGCGPDEMHEVMLCESFGSKDVLTPSGRSYRIPTQRSSDLTIEEYSMLIDTLMRCAAFAGCVLPDPE